MSLISWAIIIINIPSLAHTELASTPFSCQSLDTDIITVTILSREWEYDYFIENGQSTHTPIGYSEGKIFKELHMMISAARRA